MSAERPFRHLCPEADMRDAMTDDEFWGHVALNLAPDWNDDDTEAALEAAFGVVSIDAPPCAECGEVGACAFDAEGRALIHVTPDDDGTT